MRRSSSTWLFSLWLLLAGPLAAAARPFPCLFPVFEGGRRLHDYPVPSAYWFQLLLRQHEVCWRRPRLPGEVRVALFGNSAVFGFPLPVEETFGERLNQHFAADAIPAHVFNLASFYTIQLRDAVLMHETLPYEPDLILYPVALNDFAHALPAPGPLLFLERNLDALRAMLDDPPAGLVEPVEFTRETVETEEPVWWTLRQLRELGPLSRAAVTFHARSIVRRMGAEPKTTPQRLRGRQTQYDCAATREQFALDYQDWRSWNILAYLEQLRQRHGVEVLVVTWPVAHEPVDDCYNVRYPAAGLAEFRQWVREETRARGLRHVDLLEMLPAGDFVDSLHVGAEGHDRIARRLADTLDPLLRTMAARRAAVFD